MWVARVLPFLLAASTVSAQGGPTPLENRSVSPPDDAARGEAIFNGKGACLDCHRVKDKGSRFGPDLTDIGARAADSLAGRAQAALERSLLEPDAEILPQNRTVRLVTRDGVSSTARLLNQDTFTLQVIDSKEHVTSVAKSSLREYSFMKNSPMPSYRDKFSPQDLADVIAYLVSLKGITK